MEKSQASLISVKRSPVAALKGMLNFKALSKLLSDEGLTRKASLNALAAALDYGAGLVTGFLINPWLISGLGNYLFGAWQILGRLIDYLSAAGGRPTQTLKMTIAYQQASTDYDAKRRSVGSAVVVWSLFTPLMIMTGGLLAWFAPSLLQAPAGLTWILRVTAGVLVADLVMTNLAGVPESVVRGENLGYKRMGLTTLLVFVQGGVIAIALYFKTGIVGVAVATLLNTLLTGGLFLYIVGSYVPWFGFARPALAEVRQFFGLSVWFLAWRMVMQLMLASDVVVLGLLNSVEKVTAYTVTKYTPETVISLVAIVVGGVAPGLGGMIGSSNLKKAASVRGEIMAGTWLISTAVGATILLWNRSFVRLWVGAQHYAGSLDTMFIMLMTIQFVLIRNDANIIDLTLSLRRKVLIGTLSAIVSLALAGVLVRFFNLGIIGVCVGLMAGRSLLSVGYPWIMSRFLKVSFISQFKSVLRPALVTAALFTLVMVVADVVTAKTWVSLVLSVGVTFIVVLLPAFYLGLSSDQRTHVLKRFQTALRPVSKD